MQLLFVSNLYPPVVNGGYELICRDVAEELGRRGHGVEVLTSDFRSAEVAGPEDGVFRDLRVKDLSMLGGGSRMDVVTQTRNGLHNASALRARLRRKPADVVMFWNGASLGRSMLMAAEATPPVVYYLSDPWLTYYTGSRGRTLHSRLNQAGGSIVMRLRGVPFAPVRAAHVVLPSLALLRQYVDEGTRFAESRIIPHGISPERFPARPQRLATRPSGEPARILYAGRINPAKGVATLVRGFSLFRRQPGMDACRLVLAGPLDHPEFELELHRMLDELDLRRSVDLLGMRPREEVARLYGEHDVLVFPSEWNEPFSISVLEAMASAIPVVATLRGGSAEILRGGENAVVFRAGDPDDLCRALLRALSDPSGTAAIGRRGSEEVHRRYTLKAQVDALEAYLFEVLGG